MTRPAVLMVLGSCASLQVGAALAANLFPVAGSSGATVLRLGLAAVILLTLARPAVRGWQRHQWRAAILLGIAMAGMNGFFYAAIERIPLGPAVTIEFLGPLVLAAVLSRRPRDLAWVLLAGAGVAIMGFADGAAPLDPLGVAYVLVAAVFWALYILAGSRAGTVIPGNGGLAIGLSVATLAVLPLGLGGAVRAVSAPPLLLIAVGTAILASVIPYTLEMAALRRLPRPVFGILLSLEPAVAALAGWLLLAQPLSWPVALAITVVIAATIGSTISATRAAARPESAPAPEPASRPTSVSVPGRGKAAAALDRHRPSGTRPGVAEPVR
ncbi:EamA family transporter [Actinoplanes sp. NPDC051494]|uniref:EamA family transporter n=1 Tax=Actinoplanes sp. NPDC051494 TaxID=3363907 RepID=UPI00379C4C65